MKSPGSVEGRERIRLFVALSLPQDGVERLAAWQERELGGLPDTRLVPGVNLHVTLAFLGWRPAVDVAGILEVAREAAHAAERPVLTATGYRETRSVGMVVFADEAERSARLAEAVGEGLERLGVYERETPEMAAARDRPSLPSSAAGPAGASRPGPGQSVRSGSLSFGAAAYRGAVRDSSIGSSGRLTP